MTVHKLEKVPGVLDLMFVGQRKTLEEELRGEFNVFLRGHEWTAKARVGLQVGLAHDKGGEVLGRAVITDVCFGQLDDMLETHAVNHHATADTGELRGILRSTHGPEATYPGELYTVLYVVRLLD